MKKRSIAEIIGIIGLVVLGGINLYDVEVQPYFCESRSIAMSCDRLSDSGKTCYNEDVGNKRCTEGWAQLVSEAKEPVRIFSGSGYYTINGIRVRK